MTPKSIGLATLVGPCPRWRRADTPIPEEAAAGGLRPAVANRASEVRAGPGRHVTLTLERHLRHRDGLLSVVPPPDGRSLRFVFLRYRTSAAILEAPRCRSCLLDDAEQLLD